MSLETPADSLNAARRLRKAGQHQDALETLRCGLRRQDWPAELLESAGRFLAKEFEAATIPEPPTSALLLGECTTNWLATSLTATAWGSGLALSVKSAEYDNILQELFAAQNGNAKPALVILVPWGARLLQLAAEEHPRLLDETLDFWRQAWQLSAELGVRVIQCGYDLPLAGPLGTKLSGEPGGALNLIRTLNERLRSELPAGGFFLDVDYAAGQFGKTKFYEARRYFWTKQPWSETGTAEFARVLAQAARAAIQGPKKVLVLDLDNTLWGGVVGEVGPLGIELGENADGEAFRALQSYAKELTKRGVLLAVCSKNNPADAREPFERNPAMLLKLDDIAAFEASWDPKSAALERISETLRLGLDSFVFLDDNPTEREQIRQALPMVEVVELPADPAEYLPALERGGWFETVGLTTADNQRAEQYQAENQRQSLADRAANLDVYLESLELRGDLRPIDEADLSRVEQLLAKTNQFNLTTRRHSREQVKKLLDQSRAIGLTLRVQDRFGDYGLIAVMIGIPSDGNTLCLETWLMSCRVIGRTVEEYLVSKLCTQARERGYARIEGVFLPTKKNELVKELYERLGFARVPHEADESGTKRFTFDLAQVPAWVTFVKDANALHD